MSDCDIRQFENILLEAMVGLQRGNMKTHAMREREFYETIAEQSGNSALIEALRQFGLQIQLCGTISGVNGEFAERAANGYVDIIKAFKARDHSTRHLSRPRPYQLRAGSDSCALP